MSTVKNLLAIFLLFAGLSDLSAQDRVSGIVTDEAGEPLVGVSVVTGHDGNLTGAVTDADGRYEIAAAEGQTLEFSCVGFETVRITLGGGEGLYTI